MKKPVKPLTMAQTNAILAKNGHTLTNVVKNILAMYDRATPANIADGAKWYGSDSMALVRDLSVLGGISPEAAASVLAQTSPRTTWSRNVAVATAIVQSWGMSVSAGLSAEDRDAAVMAAGRACGGMSANITRALIALSAAHEGECPISTINGPKTNAFARNLLGDRNAVTVDVWAVRIALNPTWARGEDDMSELILNRAGMYQAVAQAYRIAANRRNVDATDMQATTWIVVRNGRSG